MPHFAILSPSFAGHLVPCLLIGRHLQERGHRITVISDEEARTAVVSYGLEFCILPKPSRPSWWLTPLLILGWPFGQAPNVRLRKIFSEAAIRWLTEAPAILEALSVDALLIEQYVTAGGSIASLFGLPFATVSTAIDTRTHPYHPPPFTAWAYSEAWTAYLRNRAAHALWGWFMAPTLAAINGWRGKHGLANLQHADELLSKQANILQGCSEFDFPRMATSWRHYGGCLSCDVGRAEVAFPWDKLDGRPLVFTSFGTLNARRNLPMLELVAKVCAQLPVQLVLSRGRWNNDDDVPGLGHHFAGDPIVVDFAPQLDLLERSALMINHGGINSVMEALSCGVPQVICPRSVDQPGTAARAVRAGVALVHPFGRMSVKGLRQVVERVLFEECFRVRAQILKQQLNATGGSIGAADFIERSLISRQDF